MFGTMSLFAYTLVPSVVSISFVSMTYSLRPDEQMLVYAWLKDICAIKLFLLITIQEVYVIILDIKQNGKLAPTQKAVLDNIRDMKEFDSVR